MLLEIIEIFWLIMSRKYKLWICYCVVIKLWSNGKNGGAPRWSFWSAGVTNTIGPAMGIEALKYISYPGQVSSGLHLCFVCDDYYSGFEYEVTWNSIPRSARIMLHDGLLFQSINY